MLRAPFVRKIVDDLKESAVKQALRRVQWTLYALAPVFLVLGHELMGKRWWW